MTMNLLRTPLAAALLLTTSSMAAQRTSSTVTHPINPTALESARHSGGVNLAVNVSRVGISGASVLPVPVVPAAGTRIDLQRGVTASCPGGGPGGGCLSVRGTEAGGAAVTLRLAVASPSAAGLSGARTGATQQVRAGITLPHDRPHTLHLILDGSEVMGFSCDGRSIRLQAPDRAPFNWEVFHGSQRLAGGRSAGEAVDVPNANHLAGPGGGPLQLTVRQGAAGQIAGAAVGCGKSGCVQLTAAHGAHRIVVTPVIDRSNPFAMSTLGIRVGGVPGFVLGAVEVTRGAP